jgi:protein SCO1/2
VSKTALLALCIAVLLPLVSYLIVKNYSDKAVVMPKRYYYDTVITNVVDGKTKTDTVWHKLPEVELVNQLGDTVSFKDRPGKIIVANFFFTRCPTICPKLIYNMKTIQDALKTNDELKGLDTTIVHFLSYSVDPLRDTVEALRNYADRVGVNHDLWWMLTGPKKDIYDFVLNEYKLPLVDGENVDSNFIHTEKFVLLDRDRVIRGYYNGLDSTSIAQLAKDIVLLTMERDPKKKRNLFRK